jgi:phosphatidylserine decarboxylase
MSLLNYIPFHLLSRAVGALAHLERPEMLARLAVRLFARGYRIDPGLATQPLESFRSVGSFFTRELRSELRPFGEGISSPVDGTLRSVETIREGMLCQIKGVTYSVSALLGGLVEASKFEGGTAWSFYLSPRDAHHIFTPREGTLRGVRYIRGRLYPVNDWALANIPGLFVENERVICFLETSDGPLAVVMVGATNVGSISLAALDVSRIRNQSPQRIECEIPLARGEKLGTFHLGSTVLLLSARNFVAELAVDQLASRVVYGQPLG